MVAMDIIIIFFFMMFVGMTTALIVEHVMRRK